MTAGQLAAVVDTSFSTEFALTPRWGEQDSNHRSLSYDQYPNGLKKR